MDQRGKNIAGGQTGGVTAFVICSALALLAAAAGCFSGSCADMQIAEGGADPAAFLGFELLGAGIAIVLGFSAFGILLLPLLSAAAGFASGFVLAVVFSEAGSWGALFVRGGWMIAAALPPFTVLCAVAMGMSASVLRSLPTGLRSDGRQAAVFLKVLLLFVLAAFLPLLAAVAV